MPIRRLLLVALTTTLVAGACASEPTAEEKAAAREALLEGPVAPRAPDTNLAPEAETEPVGNAGPSSTDCADGDCAEPGGGAIDLDQALSSVPDDELRFALGAALALAADAEAACGDLPAWTQALDEAAETTRRTASAVAASGADWLDTPNAHRIANAFRDRLVLQTGCQEGAQEASEADVTAALAAAGRASAANDELLLALTSRNPATGSEFWYHADQIGHTIEIDRLVREEGPVEILIIGSSTAKRGFDPGAMTDRLGRSTMNAAVAGLFPTTMSAWTEDATGLSGEPDTIVIGVSTFQDFLECTDDRRMKMVDASRLQAFAFAAIDSLATEEPARRLIGGAAATYRSTVLDEYTPLPGSRGQMESPDVPNPESVAYYTQLYTPRMENAEYCAQNAPAVEQLVRSHVEQEREVLVVSLPLSPTMAALHPEGREVHDQSVEAYRESTQAAGGDWLDLTDLLADEEFLDLTHATSSGRAKITERTIEALS